MTSTPDFPAGELPEWGAFDPTRRDDLILELAQAPKRLAAVVDSLPEDQLDRRYRNWTIRQIVHHIADSHVHSYIRFKWALTESCPTIKAYEEADWVKTPDVVSGDVEPPLALLHGLHQKWVQTLKAMSPEDFKRSFIHPQTGEQVSLWQALNYYPWHSQHHTAQIQWLADHPDHGT